MNQHVIRPVRTDEWEKAKELRLTALNDPVAPMAFLENAAEATERPDAFWQDRTGRASQGRDVRQFIAEGPYGQWNGTVTVLVEERGSSDFLGRTVERTQGHLVAVFIRPGHRGAGLAEALFGAALEWAWSLEKPALERVRLFVHEENARAGAFYRRFGFVASGCVVPMPGKPGERELEYALPRPAPAA
ncbi:GNAT family N-acetyltransferase [Streptomyces sp. NPDC051567]|uniref:GNAT family N-acetyltransferase n=1 Tax=Streptomyces sp. NPDC051567 TaxID=3365660 RepID=UPI0037A042E4